MSEKESIFDLDSVNIETDIMDLKEAAKLKGIISNLTLYENNPKELTEIITSVLCDDNVSYLLTRISQNPIFQRLFPEFYERNQYGENVINCQQNSSYHKYGVFKHILTTISSVGNPQIPIGDWQKKLLKWTMLLHDLGKPYVKVIYENGTESFAGHDDKSVEIGKEILDRFFFSDEEKKIILTLIKYHDKYLNEGEITYDNLKFLAEELDNNKELFYLLIDVKDADAQAKSLEVYNKYKLVKNKYLEFVNSYFTFNDNSEMLSGMADINGTNAIDMDVEESEEFESAEITKSEMDAIVEGIIEKKNFRFKYQPIIDIQMKCVYGYEIFTYVDYVKKVNILDILNHAKDMGNYDKVQQTILIKAIETFQSVRSKEANLVFVNSDLHSYDKYINKPRIYDLFEKSNVAIEFQNYDKKDVANVKNIFDTIREKRGKVAIDNFGTGSLKIDDLNLLDIDYIIPDMSLIKNIAEDENKQKYLSELLTYAVARDINVIAVGVEDFSSMSTLERLGVRYMQGYYFSKPDVTINPINSDIRAGLSKEADTIII